MSRRGLLQFALLAAAGLVVAQGVAAQGGGDRVRITVIVGTDDAEVWFDKTPTTSKGKTREFKSPPIAASKKKSSYQIRARWTADGKTFDETRKVFFQAGEKVKVDFTKP